MLTVQMPEAEWVKLLNMIANQPFKQVAQLIQTIQQQLQQQLQQSQGQENMPSRPNGAMSNVESRVQ